MYEAVATGERHILGGVGLACLSRQIGEKEASQIAALFLLKAFEKP